MRAPATRAVRSAMIPWIIALVLSFVGGTFTPDHSSKEARETSGEATVSQAGEDPRWLGRSFTTPVKLPSLPWTAAGLFRPVACLLDVVHDSGHWVRQSARGLVQGRAPPPPAAA